MFNVFMSNDQNHQNHHFQWNRSKSSKSSFLMKSIKIIEIMEIIKIIKNDTFWIQKHDSNDWSKNDQKRVQCWNVKKWHFGSKNGSKNRSEMTTSKMTKNVTFLGPRNHPFLTPFCETLKYGVFGQKRCQKPPKNMQGKFIKDAPCFVSTKNICFLKLNICILSDYFLRPQNDPFFWTPVNG